MSTIKESRNAMVQESDEGEISVNQYLIKEPIGKGAFGIVSLASDKNTGKEFAAKEFSKSRLRKRKQSSLLRPSGRGSFRGRYSNFSIRVKGMERGEAEDPMDLIKGEIAILKKLHHKNVVKLFEVLDSSNDDMLYMIFELCSKGPILNVSLGGGFDHYSEAESLKLFKDILLGVEYLHENGIAHRDLKPDNLLLNENNELKIVDFGVSEMFEKGHAVIKGSTGSPAFMAPELLMSNGQELSAPAIDIWAMGVILYCMVFGKLPFSGSNILEIRDSVSGKELEVPEGTNPHLTDLLSKMLIKDPLNRIVMEDIRIHPWITEEGKNNLISLEDNVKHSVTEITDNDVFNALSSFGSVFKVIQAVNRFKHLRNRSLGMVDAKKDDAKKDDAKKDDTNEIPYC